MLGESDRSDFQERLVILFSSTSDSLLEGPFTALVFEKYCESALVILSREKL